MPEISGNMALLWHHLDDSVGNPDQNFQTIYLEWYQEIFYNILDEYYSIGSSLWNIVLEAHI